MSETMTESKDSEDLTGEDVAAWLRKHPDFLNKNPELFDILTPPQEKQGKGVADFQYYMVKRLRSDRDGVIEEAREIIENSRANMNNMSRIHRAILMLLEAHTFEDLIRTITMDFAALLDVDIVSLIVETDGEIIPHINISGVRAAPPGSILAAMNNHPVILQADMQGTDDLYGGGAGLVKSQALLFLNIGDHVPPAMIAFGSRNPELFQEGQGTEQLAFLGHVIERCFRQWLSIPTT